MSKYAVSIPYVCWVTVTVEADTEEEAVEIAFDDSSIFAYCGNGGSDKLIGVDGSNVSIEANDDPIDGMGFEINIELIED